jgi:hypothetical protein
MFYWSCLRHPAEMVRKLKDDPNVNLRFGIVKFIQANLLYSMSYLAVYAVLYSYKLMVNFISSESITVTYLLLPLLAIMQAPVILSLSIIPLALIFFLVSVLYILQAIVVWILIMLFGSKIEFIRFCSLLLVFYGAISIVVHANFFIIMLLETSISSTSTVSLTKMSLEAIVYVILALYSSIVIGEIANIILIKAFIIVILSEIPFIILKISGIL